MRKSLGASTIMLRRGWRFIWVAVFAVTPLMICAQTTYPLPKITSMHPLGGQVGTTVDVTVRGSDLDGSRSLLFTPSPNPPFEVKFKRGANGLPLPGQFTVKLPPNAKPGRYDVRFVGTFGVSNPRRFEVGIHPEVEASAGNAGPESPLKIALNTTVNGAFKTNAPVCLEVHAKKGQRLFAICRGLALDSQMESAGRAFDPNRREIARMKDHVIDFTAHEDGAHRIEIHDLMYQTGDATGFRVTVTGGPLIRFAMKDNGQGKAVLYGAQLPDGKPVPGTRLERAEIDPGMLDALLWANPLEVPLLAREDESPAAPHGNPGLLQHGQTYGGWFAPYWQPRTFELNLEKGQRYVIEVVSSRFGLPTDPSLLIESVKTDDAGKEIVATQSEILDLPAPAPAPVLRMTERDPAYAYEAQVDGKFLLHLTDSANTVGGAQYPFELRIHDASSFGLIATPAALAKLKADRTGVFGGSNVWRGGITALEIVAPYRAGLPDLIDLNLAGCPPGVTCLGGFMGPKQGIGYLAFQAADDAPAAAVPLFGWEGVGGDILYEVKDSNREPLWTRQTRGPVLGVVAADSAPARVEVVGQQPFEVAPDGKLELTLKSARNPAFTDALKMKVLGLVDSENAPSGDIPAKKDDGKIILDVKALKLAPGDYGCILQGTARMKTRRGIEELQAAEKAVLKAVAKLEELKTSQGTPETIKQAEEAKAAADKVFADCKAKAQPKDAVFLVYSNPIHLRVKEPVNK